MTTVPGQGHPDVNALADLAADVLPVEEARAVEAHVMSCPDCADVLADAERIRPVLLADDPGPIPADVWARVRGALADEAATRGGYTGHVVPMSPVPPPEQVPWAGHAGTGATGGGTRGLPDTDAPHPAAAAAPGNGVHDSAVPAQPDRPTRRSRRRQPRPAPDDAAPGTEPGRPRPDGYDDATGYTRVIRPLADLTPSAGAERVETGTLPALGGSRITGALRPGRGTGPSRRDARDSDHEPSGAVALLRKVPAGRRGALLAAAAGVVGAAVVSGIAWSLLGGGLGGPSIQAVPSGSAPPIQQSLNAPVVGTNDNYTAEDLAEQAVALAERAKGDASPATGQTTPGRTPSPSGGPTTDPTASGSATGAQPTSKLSDAAVLTRCLTALSAEDQKPIAVDIARYENREAAIIVLEGPDGGIEVWAVSRDCGSGNDASFGFAAVAP